MQHTDEQARALIAQESEFDGSYIKALREALKERIRPGPKEMIEKVSEIVEEMSDMGEWYEFMLWDGVLNALRERYRMPKETINKTS